ncbi:hypothetical protein FBY06_1184 [Pseudomonas sp. SJZ085]|uniref:hypothetical protein n=1 Tax=unclassified Pseudomonas TaxID=196821 RepID=UPI00119C8680|nr:MULTISPECIES: hypothetical protein [unclassified Pseudomonas]TWC17148.1 hypothetical protein FBX99_118140 [Pseudomonas sp. SJZ074]TWC35098.1 hypothetical protein FBY06_1184 [Pseudomonas sp. SJZ085]
MTTFEEISRCPSANRQFWSDRARSNLAFMRHNGAGPADRRLERAAFRKNMAHRRAQTYLAIQGGQLDMFGVAA